MATNTPHAFHVEATWKQPFIGMTAYLPSILRIFSPILYFESGCWKVTAEILENEIKIFYIFFFILLLKKRIAYSSYCL